MPPFCVLKITQSNFYKCILCNFLLQIGLSNCCLALEIFKEEQRAIKECERKLCSTIVGKRIEGEDLECLLSKTWDRDTIKNGETTSVKWGFGDARCSVNLHIKRQEILLSLTQKEYIAKVPAHDVNCLIEFAEQENTITLKSSPKLIFKNGKVEKIWINLSDMRGPVTITSAIWIAAELEDKFGIFHKKMIKSVNKFIEEKCPKTYNPDGSQKSDIQEKIKAKHN